MNFFSCKSVLSQLNLKRTECNFRKLSVLLLGNISNLSCSLKIDPLMNDFIENDDNYMIL